MPKSDRHPRRRSRSRTGAKVRDHKVVANPAGAVVTKSRLYPELEKLLEEQMKKRVKRNIPEELISALREHVSNNMPRRLIKLGTNPGKLKLVSGNELVQHILAKMKRIDQDFLDLLERKVSDLENDTVRASSSPSVDDSEEDVRENVWGAICDFLIPKFARYAILSHTWLQTDPEINYQDAIDYEDWLDEDGEVSDSDKKPGYAKVKSFCDVAYNEYDFSLAWCDTICINKESSAELDEAIQSMYKWYQNSFVCITYLSETDHIDNMKKDKWFKRGWTLQELIAPPRINFYAKDWERLLKDDVFNDKADPRIQRIISKVTNIEPEELISFDPLNGSDVSTRMTWAAKRETTRGEDKAYSLMGIFGVNYPISYGEGAERAFFRLIQAIISSRHISHIISTLNWAGKSLSDKIHATRLIPSRLECYDAGLQTDQQDSEDYINFYPTVTTAMNLTHLGLRVKLLVAGAQFVNYTKDEPSQKRGPFDIDLNLSFSKAPFKDLTVMLNKRYAEVPEKPSHCAFFVGIYAFKEDKEERTVEVPLDSPVFVIQIPVASTKFTTNDLTPYHIEPTAKIDTRDVPLLTYDGTGSATFEKSNLKDMNMKLLTVHL